MIQHAGIGHSDSEPAIELQFSQKSSGVSETLCEKVGRAGNRIPHIPYIFSCAHAQFTRLGRGLIGYFDCCSSVGARMWGRKDKEKRGERRKGGGASKGGAGLPFMGLGMPPGMLDAIGSNDHVIYWLFT